MSKEELKKQIQADIREVPFIESIKRLSLFGSHLNGQARQDSDIDLLIEFEPTANIGFFELARIQRALESFLGRVVDLLTPNSLSRYFRDEVLSSCEIIYEK
ncbi:nucleotidyltransferase [bacterium (Candidatus Gribaldobacteria) CG02_land_8_20_14_3_00_41_15]|uniref:Nucleotidyltransferase n=1 Tax=bacterium (Candidatus Gribaldobacteria) CG02_land_8_20_14_3_00_41_15 TaxID=2014270 RepID=A0A2M7DEG4_9BACT|nr:MAG: nucleotidyltransferase [bacterium (Candidatus Gribaldobacteria) CG02_land_8_20_14_3_00_41_15]